MSVIALAGCASIEPKGGFNAIRHVAQERLQKDVYWIQGGPEDAQVAKRIEGMLADELTLDEATQIALLNNPRLQGTYEDLGVAQSDMVQAGLLRNPVLDVVRFRNTGEGRTDWDVGIAMDFLAVFTLPMRKRIAEHDFEASKLRVSGTVLDVSAQVHQAYVDVQASQQMTELFEQVSAATEASLSAAQALREAGNITDTTLNRHRTTHTEAQLALTDARMQAASARERLNVLLGLSGPQAQWTATARMPDLPPEDRSLEEAGELAIERSLDLAAARMDIEAAARSLGLTKVTSLIPELHFGWAWENEEHTWKDGPALGIQIPLFDMGQARRAADVSALRRAQQHYAALGVEIRAAVRNARIELETSREQVLTLRNVLLPLREQITDATLLEYNAMQLGVFQLLQTRQRQVLTGQRYISALRAYWVARTRMDQLLNGRLPGNAMGAVVAMNGAPARAEANGGH